MHDSLLKLGSTDLHIRYLYRISQRDQETGRKEVVFDTENMEIENNIRSEILEKLKKELEGKMGNDINLHLDYKLNFKIDQNQVGILKKEDYPDELNQLISSMQDPSPEGKARTKKETKRKNKIPVAFAIGFDGVIYVKRVRQITVMKSKKFKDSYLAGTITHKITTLDEDFFVLTFNEPDMIIYVSKEGDDPTFIYNSSNFNLICATTDHMLELIKKDRQKLEHVIDNPDSLINYLEKSWQCVSSAYFAINRSDFKPLEQNYIDKLNSMYNFKGQLRLNAQKKLETQGLDGKKVYNIILERYGEKYTIDGGEKSIIVESYSEVS